MRIEIASIDVVSEVNMVSSGGTGLRGAEPSALWRRLPAASQRRDSFASGLRRQHEFRAATCSGVGAAKSKPGFGAVYRKGEHMLHNSRARRGC